MNLVDALKYYGRGIVLPVSEMKKLINQNLYMLDLSHIVDFGSGTLVWSQYFSKEMGFQVTAVDNRYLSAKPKNDNPNIILKTDIQNILLELEQNKIGNDAIFICDVIHHLPPSLWQNILPQIAELFDVIIIKDINANFKMGNFLNKMHDYIINGEKTENVYPQEIVEYLKKQEFILVYEELPKLWYPHFLVIATKS